MATKAEVKDEALVELGVMELGDTANPGDDTRIATAYDDVYDWLKDKGLDAWEAASGTIPDRIKPHLVYLMAENAMDTYHVPDKRAQRILRGAKIARRDLPGLIIPDYESLDPPRDF